MSFLAPLPDPSLDALQHRDVRSSLWDSYGPVMDAKALCKVLHYPSNDALQEARRRGKLPFKVLAVEGRRGIYAGTDEIADLLNRALRRTTAQGAGRRSHGEAPHSQMPP